MTGLTLPGMIEEPFCSSGRKISPIPARGPEPISARSPAILVSETARPSGARELNQRVAVGLRLERVERGGDLLEPRLLLQPCPDALGEARVGVQTGARGGPAERDLPDVDERRGDALDGQRDLGGVAAELLPERHRDGVHQVRTAGLDDVLEAFRLARERSFELLERRQQFVLCDVEGRQVHGRREDVV